MKNIQFSEIENSNGRFSALDVFRGMTICLMLMVNFPGSEENTYAPLLHAKWNGFTAADFVFPSFLFAVGNSMNFTLPKWNMLKTSQVLFKIFRRTVIIFLLGFLLFWFPFQNLIAIHPFTFPSFADARILGVLQRISISYCIASLMLFFWGTRRSIIISATILILYWIVLLYFGTGAAPLNIHTNAVLRLDIYVLGKNHLLQNEGFPFDSEGLLSTLPAITNVIAGYVAGKFMQQHGKTYEGLAKLMIVGFLLFMIASLWNYGFPINKKLWTSSFALISAGLDCLVLAGIIFCIEFLHVKKGIFFFEVFGTNPLFIYIFSIALAVTTFFIPIGNTILIDWMYENIFKRAGDYFGSLLFAVFYMLLCWSVCYLLHRKKIYIKI
jgi:predicted acyltransferase